MKLHLGCFDKPINGWVNTDMTPHIFVTRIPFLPYFLHKFRFITKERYEQHSEGVFKKVRYLDVRKSFPYANSSVEAVYCCHLLEHLTPDEAKHAVAEIYRVLQAGGIFRVVVPDLDIAVKNYSAESPDEFLLKMYQCNIKGNKNQHHWMYNSMSLSKLLTDNGFKNIQKCEYKKGRCPDIADFDSESRPESLFIEAEKKGTK